MSKFAEYDPRPHPRPAAPDWTIRDARAGDVPVIARITAEREEMPLADALVRADRLVTESLDGSRIVLVAARGVGVVAHGKADRFTPPDPGPERVCPAGWYLAGVIVEQQSRRLGIGHALTRARLLRLAEKAPEAWYVVNERNLASIALHERFGFTEFTREFVMPGLTFEGGRGILFRCDLTLPSLCAMLQTP